MNLLKIILVGCLVIAIAGCTSRSAQVPVEGDMDGRSYTFCAGKLERIDVGEGFICRQFGNFYFEIETHYAWPEDDIKLGIANAFETKVISYIDKLRKEVNLEKVYYTGYKTGFDTEARRYTPHENAFRIEVHLLGNELNANKLDSNCQSYWILMLTNDLYMRTSDRFCEKDSSNHIAEISSNIVSKIYKILENDIYK